MRKNEFRTPLYRKLLSPIVWLAVFIPGVAASEIETDLADTLRELDIGIDTSITGTLSGKTQNINYCLNMLDDARETRNAVLTERLTVLESDVDEKLDVMNKRIAVLKEWVQRRDQFLARTNDSLVEIFQTMRADAAASQLTEIGPELSASIIAKLEPKYSSAILAEMKPTDAAKIAMTLTSLISKHGKQ